MTTVEALPRPTAREVADLLRNLRTLDRDDPAAVAAWTARKADVLARIERGTP